MLARNKQLVAGCLRGFQGLVRGFAKDSKNMGSIPRPPNPTMEESFGTKFSSEQVEKFMNPRGFLSEKEMKNYEGVEEIPTKPTEAEKPAEPVEQTPPEQAKQSSGRDTKEYGFRVKGPEPTRYGDWERNGRCFDF